MFRMQLALGKVPMIEPQPAQSSLLAPLSEGLRRAHSDIRHGEEEYIWLED